jgi:hypothetical protein
VLFSLLRSPLLSLSSCSLSDWCTKTLEWVSLSTWIDLLVLLGLFRHAIIKATIIAIFRLAPLDGLLLVPFTAHPVGSEFTEVDVVVIKLDKTGETWSMRLVNNSEVGKIRFDGTYMNGQRLSNSQ